MTLSTRLLLPLVGTVVLVMLGYATWSLVQRETVMVAEAERETRAYATALGLAIERAAGQADPDAIQEMIDRVDRDPNIYGVIVYDSAGVPRHVSAPLTEAEPVPEEEIRAVMARGRVETVRRPVLDEESMVVFRPLVERTGRASGVLEVVQPLTSVRVQLSRTRQRFLLNTLTLVVAMAGLLSWLVRRHLSAPLERFVLAVRALGGGDLTHRIEPDTAAGELSGVAEELNRMADRLEGAHRELVLEVEERVSLERRLVNAEKLAEVGQLAAGLAHEIGAPLQVIRGRADLLLRGDPDVGRNRNLSIIVRQIDRISAIVQDLLRYARRREPEMARVDLVELVREAVEFVDTDAVRGTAEVTVASAVARLEVTCDPDLVHQLLLNVLLNALHAVGQAERPGRIAVRMAVRSAERGPLATVEVEDNGPGIPVDRRDRVFDPFYTTKHAAGTGLGLALARAIVEDHGGAIAIAPPSGPGWSTRVAIELPATAEVETGVEAGSSTRLEGVHD